VQWHSLKSQDDNVATGCPKAQVSHTLMDRISAVTAFNLLTGSFKLTGEVTTMKPNLHSILENL
jgi:hypothetical protein